MIHERKERNNSRFKKYQSTTTSYAAQVQMTHIIIFQNVTFQNFKTITQGSSFKGLTDITNVINLLDADKRKRVNFVIQTYESKEKNHIKLNRIPLAHCFHLFPEVSRADREILPKLELEDQLHSFQKH